MDRPSENLVQGSGRDHRCTSKEAVSNELALQNSLVIGLKDLFDGKASAEVIEQLTSNPENMNSFVQSEMTSSHNRVGRWLEKQ